MVRPPSAGTDFILETLGEQGFAFCQLKTRLAGRGQAVCGATP
jgi:hypothetical protein